MGKYKKGILGPFRGKVGTVVGSSWMGQYYLKSLPDFGDDNPTPAQLNVRAKMSLVTKFLKLIKPLIKVGYQQFTKGLTPMNAATSYHLKNAVSGTSALNYAINYTEVVMSVGTLLPPASPQVVIDTAAKVDFSWLNDAPVGGTGGTDRATVVVYNKDRDKFVTLPGAAARSVLTYELSIPADFSGEEINCWMFFVNTDGKEVSDSIYLGEFTAL
jgi:hypothetical protein